jgi:GR25 family glycosyltransferase involved in LPS biosynthesis
MEGDIHVYCINLKHRADRWERFSKQPELQQIMKQFSFERFEAVNGSALNIMKDDRISLRTKRNIKEHTRRDHEELDSAGGVGCYLSHTGVWKNFLERSQPYAIVLEDDADLYDGFVADLQLAMKDTSLLPQMPDVWFFNPPIPEYYEYKGKPYPLSISERKLGPWVTNTCATFTGYLISRRGAEKLLETAFPIDMHVDMYTCLAGDLKRVFTVAHRNITLKNIELKSLDSDIRTEPDKDCMICNIPTNFERRGIVVVNMPVLVLGLAIIGSLFYLTANGKRRH